MIRKLASMRSDASGAGTVELAFCIPVVLTAIIGILQLGTLGFANAGLQQAVESGARFATLFPTPTDAQIIAKTSASRYGLDSSRITGPTVTHGTSNGVSYIDLTMSYSVPINFVFFSAGSFSLSKTQRAYTVS